MTAHKNINLGSLICKIQYQLVSNVNSFDRGSSKFHYLVSFIDELDWLDFYHTPGSINFDEPLSRVNAGRLYTDKLSFKYPGQDDDTIALSDNISGQGIIILITWSDGSSRIIGDVANPVKITPDFKSDPSGTGFIITIEHKSSHPAFWLDAVSGGGGIPD